MLRPLGDDDLEMVLQWRNHPAVRANMYNSHEISLAEHHSWWARTAQDKCRRYFVFEDEGDPSGVVAFTDIDGEQGTASWAFYAREKARKGIGTRMEVAALRYAFGELGLFKLNCEVLSHNMRVVRMHQKFGFRIEGIFRKHHRAGERRLDVYRLAMFAQDWSDCLARQAQQILDGERPRAILSLGDAHVVDLVFPEPGPVATSMVVERVCRVAEDVFPGKGVAVEMVHANMLRDVPAGRDLRLSLDILSVFGENVLLRADLHDEGVRVFSAEARCRPGGSAARMEEIA